MVITFVMDQFEEGNNGTTMTVRRFVDTLRSFGHTVYVICGKGSGKDVIETGESVYPFKKLIHSEGMLFGRFDKKIIEPIIKKSDVVHFVLPFIMSRKIKNLCDKLNVPTTAAFHCQPQNISSAIHLGHAKLFNKIIFDYFRTFYKKFSDIHCPSVMIRDELVRHHYKSNLHVISNGISDYFHKVDCVRPIEYQNKILIVMVGRYAVEKRQDLIINACKNSKYESKIQLIFSGKGPREKYLKKISKGLTNEPIWGFHTPEDLRNILSYSDLYVHASDAEIEGMACTEAIACGMVPIISDSKKSATSQFAICPESVFKAGDYMDLRDKIDYLLDNPHIKEELSVKYSEEAKKYRLENCVREFEQILIKMVNK